jgi:hypothetical protein
MPRWVWGLIVIIVLLAFIIPNPVGTGHAVGNAVSSVVHFITSTVRAI